MSKKRQNFPVSWYVSRIVCLAYSAPPLYTERNTQRHMPSTPINLLIDLRQERVVSSFPYVEQPTPPKRARSS